MGEVLEQMVRSNELKETMIFLVKTSIIVIAITAVLVVALQIQVWSRNKQIDQVQRIVCAFAGLIPEERRGESFGDCSDYLTMREIHDLARVAGEEGPRFDARWYRNLDGYRTR